MSRCLWLLHQVSSVHSAQEAGSAEEDALEERGEAQEAVTQLEAGVAASADRALPT